MKQMFRRRLISEPFKIFEKYECEKARWKSGLFTLYWILHARLIEGNSKNEKSNIVPPAATPDMKLGEEKDTLGNNSQFSEVFEKSVDEKKEEVIEPRNYLKTNKQETWIINDYSSS